MPVGTGVQFFVCALLSTSDASRAVKSTQTLSLLVKEDAHFEESNKGTHYAGNASKGLEVGARPNLNLNRSTLKKKVSAAVDAAWLSVQAGKQNVPITLGEATEDELLTCARDLARFLIDDSSGDVIHVQKGEGVRKLSSYLDPNTMQRLNEIPTSRVGDQEKLVLEGMLFQKVGLSMDLLQPVISKIGVAQYVAVLGPSLGKLGAMPKGDAKYLIKVHSKSHVSVSVYIQFPRSIAAATSKLDKAKFECDIEAGPDGPVTQVMFNWKHTKHEDSGIAKWRVTDERQ